MHVQLRPNDRADVAAGEIDAERWRAINRLLGDEWFTLGLNVKRVLGSQTKYRNDYDSTTLTEIIDALISGDNQ